MTTFWDTAPCNLVEVDRRFRGAYRLHHQGITIALMVEAVHTSETSVDFNDTRRYIAEGCHFHTRRRKNLKSHKMYIFILYSLSISLCNFISLYIF
jgi:hypothetical protein